MKLSAPSAKPNARDGTEKRKTTRGARASARERVPVDADVAVCDYQYLCHAIRNRRL